MKQRNSTIELPNSFQPEIWQGSVAGKSFKKIRYRQNCFLIRTILMVKKYMHENLKHAVKKELAKKIKWLKKLKSILTFRQLLPTIENTFSDLVSNNTDTFIELLTNNTTHFSRH